MDTRVRVLKEYGSSGSNGESVISKIVVRDYHAVSDRVPVLLMMADYYMGAHGIDGNVFIEHNGQRFNMLECELEKWLGDGAFLKVAEIGNKLIGFSSMVSPFREVFWVRAAYCLPEYRGNGLHYLMGAEFLNNGAKVWFYQTIKHNSEKMLETPKRKKLASEDKYDIWMEEV